MQGLHGKSIYRMLFFGLMLSISFLSTAQTRTITVGAFNNYPVIFRDNDGVIKGLYVDLLSEIGKKENINFTYVFGTWNEGLERVQSGEVDLLTSVGYTPERALFMDYCRNPILTVWGELYALQSSEINGILNIADKKIGIMKGDINAQNFTALSSAFGIKCTFIEYASYLDVFTAIADKKVDAGVAGITFGAANEKKYGLKSTGVVFNPINIYFATAKGKNRNLRVLLDSYLEKWKLQNDSAFDRAKETWLYASFNRASGIPSWLVPSLFILAGVLAIAFVFILLLRIQVKKATDKIQESEEIFSQFMKHSPIYVFFKDENIRSLRLSANYAGMLGKPIEDLIGKNMMELFPSEIAEKMVADDQKVLKEGQVVTIDEDFNGKNFSTIKFSFSTSNKKKYLAGFTIDLTERKQAEEKIKFLLAEKELLLKEVHHRIKNNMTSIKGLLSLQIASEKNPSAIESLKDAESRVQSIITLYDKLYCTDNYRELPMKEYLMPLAEEIVSSFTNKRTIRLSTDISDIVLKVQLLSPLGIIVNELMTNIMKHAFIGRESGLIKISTLMKEGRMSLIIEDDGVGIPESVTFEKSTGFGMQIVGMLTEQIGGSISIERGAGTKFVLEFNA